MVPRYSGIKLRWLSQVLVLASDWFNVYVMLHNWLVMNST